MSVPVVSRRPSRSPDVPPPVSMLSCDPNGYYQWAPVGFGRGVALAAEQREGGDEVGVFTPQLERAHCPSSGISF